jgi:hypothetical protein
MSFYSPIPFSYSSSIVAKANKDMASDQTMPELNAQVVLVEVLKTLQRLEGNWDGQDKRLYLIEQTIRSGSLSFRTSSEESGDRRQNGSSTGSYLSHDQLSLRIEQSPLSTPPSTPVVDGKESATAQTPKRKFDFEDSIYGQDDSFATSCYSLQLQPRDAQESVLDAQVSIAVPPRSPLRVTGLNTSSDATSNELQAQNRHLEAQVLAFAYETASSGPEPSRIKPSEVYGRQTTTVIHRSLLPSVRSVLKIDLQSIRGGSRALERKFHSWAANHRRPRDLKAEIAHQTITSNSKAGVAAGDHRFGPRGFWRCIVLIFTSKHRSRPYIAA